MNRDEPRFREQLAAARERAGLTMQGLADLAGVSRGTIWNWESGTITPPPLYRLGVLEFLDRYAEQKDADE